MLLLYKIMNKTILNLATFMKQHLFYLKKQTNKQGYYYSQETRSEKTRSIIFITQYQPVGNEFVLKSNL